MSWFRKLFGSGEPAAQAKGVTTVLATPTWRIAFPPDWTLDSAPGDPSQQLRGPHGSVVTLSTAHITGAGSDADRERVVRMLETTGLETVARTQQGMQVVRPGVRQVLPDGTIFHESLTGDDEDFLANYLLIKGQVMILVTHQGPHRAQSAVPVVRSALISVAWL